MTPEIRTLPARTAIGLSAPVIPLLDGADRASDNMQVIPNLWRSLGARLGDIPREAGSERISVICAPNPLQADGKLDYLAGFTVSTEPTTLPDDVSVRAVPAGTYAIFTHKGPASRLAHTKNYIFGSWLPKSGYRRGDGPQFTLYGERFDPMAEDSEIYIHIPIEAA